MTGRDTVLCRVTAPREPRGTVACFPYAGGGTAPYRRWRDVLPPDIACLAVRLPGRESRVSEAPFRTVDAAVSAVAPALVATVTGPLILFGHSYGALLAFETARRLRAAGTEVAHLVVSAAAAPQLPRRSVRLSQMPANTLVDFLARMDGTPGLLLENREILELFLPALRADLAASETFVYRAAPPLDCPITAAAGKNDPTVALADIAAWEVETKGPFRTLTVPGRHMYLERQRAILVATLVGTLEVLDRVSAP